MNIVASEDFAGSAMIAVRDTVRILHHRYDGVFDRESYEQEFQGTSGTQGAVFAALLAAGYIRPATDRQKKHPRFRSVPETEVWSLTERGGALALASAAKPVKRATADRALADFLDRVNEAATDPRCVYVAERVVLFGSMLDPERDPVSDVDIALKLVRDENKIRALGLTDNDMYNLFYREAMLSHITKDSDGILGEVGVLRRLKARKTSLSLHELGDDTVAGFGHIDHRVIYQRPTS